MSSIDESTVIEGFVTLHIPCQYSYLRIVRQSISNICVHSGLSEFKAAQLEMAVDEACSNIIERNDKTSQNMSLNPDREGLRLNLIQKKDCIVVELYDYGPAVGFVDETVGDPELYAEDPQSTDLGMYVIKRFVDDIQYEPATQAGNYLRLKKLL